MRPFIIRRIDGRFLRIRSHMTDLTNYNEVIKNDWVERLDDATAFSHPFYLRYTKTFKDAYPVFLSSRQG